MKKKILFLLILLLLTGCKANYNLKINFGGNVVETGTIYLNSNLLGKGKYPSEYKEFLNQISNDYYLNNYRKKFSFNKNGYFGYNIYSRYHNVTSYANQSPAIKALFTGLITDKSDHYVVLKTTEENKISNYHNVIGDIQTIVEAIEINISLPYRVVKHNATNVDTNTNTYTWKFYSNTTNKGINLEYRDNELFTYNPVFLLEFVSPYIYITVALAIILLIIISAFRSRARYVDKL